MQGTLITLFVVLYGLLTKTMGLNEIGCPNDDWFPRDKYCHLVVAEEADWETAKAGCNTLGSLVDLMSVWNQAEWKFLKQELLPLTNGSEAAWLGYEKRGSRWAWTDSSEGEDYRVWETQSDEDRHEIDCLAGAVLNPSALYQARNCSQVLGAYFCKTGRTVAYEMGLPWMNYTTSDTMERVQDYNAALRTSYFFLQLSPLAIFQHAPALATKSVMDATHCAVLCLAMPPCVYVQLYCLNVDKCDWNVCVLKTFV